MATVRRRLADTFMGGCEISLATLGADNDITTVGAVRNNMSETMATSVLRKKRVILIRFDCDNLTK